MIALNVTNTADFIGWGSLLQNAPKTISDFSDIALSKWALALACFIVGMCVADSLVRYSLQPNIDPERWPCKWVERRRRNVLAALTWPILGKLVDVAAELSSLDAALISMKFPPLPSLDPDAPAITDTILYLRLIAPLTLAQLPMSRERAASLIKVLEHPADRPIPRGRLRLVASLLTTMVSPIRPD